MEATKVFSLFLLGKILGISGSTIYWIEDKYDDYSVFSDKTKDAQLMCILMEKELVVSHIETTDNHFKISLKCSDGKIESKELYLNELIEAMNENGELQSIIQETTFEDYEKKCLKEDGVFLYDLNGNLICIYGRAKTEEERNNKYYNYNKSMLKEALEK